MVGGGTDGPVVPVDPFLSMWWMTTRQVLKGYVLGKEHAISAKEALQLYTINNARIQGVAMVRQHAATVHQPVKVDNELYVRDYSKCILCYKCVEGCGTDWQNTFAIAVAGRGFDARIATELKPRSRQSTLARSIRSRVLGRTRDQAKQERAVVRAERGH